MMYNEIRHPYKVRRKFSIGGWGQVPFSDRPASDANVYFDMRVTILEEHYPNGLITFDGYAVHSNSGNLDVIAGLEMKIVADGCEGHVLFTKQYTGSEIVQKGFHTLGEIHEHSCNFLNYKSVNVYLQPSWIVHDAGMGFSVPTVPGTLNTIPLHYITTKHYKLK